MPEIPVMQLPQQPLVQAQALQQPVLGMPGLQQSNTVSSGVLTAAQTQYFTQLSQQTSENLKATGQPSYSSTISSQVFLFSFTSTILHVLFYKKLCNLIYKILIEIL